MLIPIRCFTCGKTLADKYDYYVKQAQAEALIQKDGPSIKEKAKGNKGKEKMVDTTPYFDVVKTGPILDKMGLTRYCCRRHMLATVDMMDTI